MTRSPNPRTKEIQALVRSAVRRADIPSMADFYKRIGISAAAFSAQLKRGRVRPETAKKIEEVTGGKVTRQELCPEVFL